jgi:hypothetical protein
MGEIVQSGDCPNLRVHAHFAGLYSPAQLSDIAAFLKSTDTSPRETQ